MDAVLAGVDPHAPLLMDLSNFEGMGTLLHPHLEAFLACRTAATAWWAFPAAREHLTSLGVEPSSVFDTRAEALEYLTA